MDVGDGEHLGGWNSTGLLEQKYYVNPDSDS
jgi:hypothetical protein